MCKMGMCSSKIVAYEGSAIGFYDKLALPYRGI